MKFYILTYLHNGVAQSYPTEAEAFAWAKASQLGRPCGIKVEKVTVDLATCQLKFEDVTVLALS